MRARFGSFSPSLTFFFWKRTFSPLPNWRRLGIGLGPELLEQVRVRVRVRARAWARAMSKTRARVRTMPRTRARVRVSSCLAQVVA